MYWLSALILYVEELRDIASPLFNSIKRLLKDRVMAPFKPRIKILSAKIKKDAGIKSDFVLVFHGY